MSQDPATRRENASLTRRLLLFTAGSFAFGFALVPLYDVICEAAGIRVNETPATVAETAATGREFEGKVRAIAPAANPQTRNILVFVDLPRHAELKAGTFARGAFDLGEAEALTVASASVVVRDGHNYVFVIGADNKAAQRKIDTGRRVGDRVEVLQGLKADEAVAVQGAGFLNEGDLVKVAP